MIIAALTFTLASSTFKPNTAMPLKTVYTQCGGSNVSPQLQWSGAPKGTKSFALIVHDPDAPHPGGWYHWIFYNVPAATASLSEQGTMPSAKLGKNDFGDTAYDGPCPPPGKVHHYNFTLYALDEAHVGGDALTGPQLERAIAGHVLAKTTLTGLYETH
jgi:Raf kinase inhibitor-like YbhB/YbcL family protein